MEKYGYTVQSCRSLLIFRFSTLVGGLILAAFLLLLAGGQSFPVAIVQAEDPPTFLFSFGSEGSGDGEFFNPSDIAIDSSGTMWVADYGNDRIQKFDSNGNYILDWASGDPFAIDVDQDGNVYVGDNTPYWRYPNDNERILKYDSDGILLSDWGSEGSGDGQFMSVEGLAVDSSGFVYAADVFLSRVQKFDLDGDFKRSWGSFGDGDYQFESPEHIDVDSSGNVYVVDSGNARVQKFDSNGNFLGSFGSGGTGDGQFDFPLGVAVDCFGDVLVTDYRLNRIQKFASNGVPVTSWGSTGSGDGQFQNPYGIEVVGGYIYVTDLNHRVQVFNANLDCDNDGIFDDVDTEPDTTSNDFSDGTTTGSITDRGDRNLSVTDATDVNEGVTISADASGGAAPATITACEGTSVINLDAGDQATVTCSSVTIDVLAGSVEITFIADDGTIGITTLSPGANLTFDPTVTTFTANDGSVSVTVLVEGVELALDPGESHMVVEIDIKPGSDPNCFNNNGHGVIPVAVLGSASFDVTQVDPDSIKLEDMAVKAVGKKDNLLAEIEDSNQDGFDDLVVKFKDEDGMFQEGNSMARLTGDLNPGSDVQSIWGKDAICIVP